MWSPGAVTAARCHPLLSTGRITLPKVTESQMSWVGRDLLELRKSLDNTETCFDCLLEPGCPSPCPSGAGAPELSTRLQAGSQGAEQRARPPHTAPGHCDAWRCPHTVTCCPRPPPAAHGSVLGLFPFPCSLLGRAPLHHGGPRQPAAASAARAAPGDAHCVQSCCCCCFPSL